jgi:hypothetical protein
MSKGRLVNSTPHVELRRVEEYNEYRVSYRGIKAEREEAMAYYTDDLEDATDTMVAMENTYIQDVFEVDKLPVKEGV